MASARKMNRKPVKTGSLIEALQRGEKPLVMWKGKNLVDEIYDLAKGNKISKTRLSKVRVNTLKKEFLLNVSWKYGVHSESLNRFVIDKDKAKKLTPERVEQLIKK